MPTKVIMSGLTHSCCICWNSSSDRVLSQSDNSSLNFELHPEGTDSAAISLKPPKPQQPKSEESIRTRWLWWWRMAWISMLSCLPLSSCSLPKVTHHLHCTNFIHT
jgi:hypothetical protein